MSGYFSDVLSYVGAKERQGPHHSAQKSMKTVSLSLMVWSKFSLVRATVAMVKAFPGKSVRCRQTPIIHVMSSGWQLGRQLCQVVPIGLGTLLWYRRSATMPASHPGARP